MTAIAVSADTNASRHGRRPQKHGASHSCGRMQYVPRGGAQGGRKQGARFWARNARAGVLVMKLPFPRCGPPRDLKLPFALAVLYSTYLMTRSDPHHRPGSVSGKRNGAPSWPRRHARARGLDQSSAEYRRDRKAAHDGRSAPGRIDFSRAVGFIGQYGTARQSGGAAATLCHRHQRQRISLSWRDHESYQNCAFSQICVSTGVSTASCQHKIDPQRQEVSLLIVLPGRRSRKYLAMLTHTPHA